MGLSCGPLRWYASGAEACDASYGRQARDSGIEVLEKEVDGQVT